MHTSLQDYEMLKAIEKCGAEDVCEVDWSSVSPVLTSALARIRWRELCVTVLPPPKHIPPQDVFRYCVEKLLEQKRQQAMSLSSLRCREVFSGQKGLLEAAIEYLKQVQEQEIEAN